MKKFIEKNIKKILSLFFILQPFLDVSAGIMLNVLKINYTLSSIVRFIFLFFCIYYLLFVSNKKHIIFLLLFILYLFVFSLNVYINKDLSVLFYELKNTFNTFYFPIVFLSLYDMFRQYDIKVDIKNVVFIYVIYLLLIFIPNLTHTGFMSYSESKVGSSGWFLSANSVGNILSILFPFVIFYLVSVKGKFLFKLFIIISNTYVLFSIGTKTPLLSILMCVCLTFVYFFFSWFKNKRYKIVLISSSVAIFSLFMLFILIPKSSFYKNILIHKEFLGIDSYVDVFKDYRLIDHFIFSQRLTFLSNTSNSYVNSDIFSKLFGIGYIENYGTDYVSTKMVEMDYFDVLYRHGFVGFVLFFSFLSMVFHDKKLYNSFIGYEVCISLFFVFLLAFFTGHILISPSVSIFVALVIICFKGGLHEENYER